MGNSLTTNPSSERTSVARSAKTHNHQEHPNHLPEGIALMLFNRRIHQGLVFHFLLRELVYASHRVQFQQGWHGGGRSFQLDRGGSGPTINATPIKATKTIEKVIPRIMGSLPSSLKNLSVHLGKVQGLVSTV
jgi:hypothetical protein